MAFEEYQRALKIAQKDRKSAELKGRPTGLLTLPDQPEKLAYRRESLGIVEIPAELIVGTCNALRADAFSPGFYPALPAETEFGEKWMSLCKAHLDEGIRDPIKAVEYLNRYYVVEGHKRVSVLKYFGAVSIPGVVTRLLPYPSDEPEVLAYQEFLEFYHMTGQLFLVFRQPGQYAKLLELMGCTNKEVWGAEFTYAFRAFYYMFREAYLREYEDEQGVAQAFLTYIEIFGYQESIRKLPSQLEEDLSKIKQEIQNKVEQVENTVVLDDNVKMPFLYTLRPTPDKIHVAFIHRGNTETSKWTYSHEYGRIRMERAMRGQVSTQWYENVDTDEQAEQVIEDVIRMGADIIFTTHPQLLLPSVKQAVLHPEAKILNCSLNTNYPSVRTYYPRLYGAKFIKGAIAGAMSRDGRIGYVTDYPTYGGVASINAFAQGARMVNAHAKIYLEWCQLQSGDGLERLRQKGINLVDYHDQLHEHRDGVQDDTHNLALVQCYWGKFYQRLVRRVMDGSWKLEERGASAVNYWWGMTQGVVSVLSSRRVPAGTRRLVGLFRDAMRNQKLDPFYGTIYNQRGQVVHSDEIPLSTQKILTMNWLSSYVEGRLPDLEEFTPKAQELIRLQGVERRSDT